MTEERLDLLEKYLRSGFNPILVEGIPSDSFHNSVVLKSTIDPSELNGHYEGSDFCPPTWYQELVEKSKLEPVILLIENINEIPIKEQPKFIELLKYKKISTFSLPSNCLILVTCKNLKERKLSEEVFSLLAMI